ncbi:MAG: 3-phosphoshikimate 1-carboxyvinyltransferase [Planctomycetota bacterium]
MQFQTTDASAIIDKIEIQPHSSRVDGTIRPPGSKSITNRALMIAAMAEGKSLLVGGLESDDTHFMSESLKRLGVGVTHTSHCASRVGSQALSISGSAGKFAEESAQLFIGNSGTSVRFLTAMLGIHGGDYRLDGVPRMRQRPIGPLVDALNQLGANVTAESFGGCPPVRINNIRLTGGETEVGGSISSQYLSGLLMAAPLAESDVIIQVTGDLISKPYVTMTLAVMKSFGVEVDVDSEMKNFRFSKGSRYIGREYAIEPDASAASYFWAAAAICGGTAKVTGLHRNALQGDVEFVDCLEKMGCRVAEGEDWISITGPATQGADLDMGHISDTVQSLAAVALFVDGPTTVRNIAHNRVKETDRIGNLAIELRKLGARVDEFEDGLTIHPEKTQPAEIETYDDHRMAMSLSLVGLRQAGVIIKDPKCVSKTYPRFFQDMNQFLKQG